MDVLGTVMLSIERRFTILITDECKGGHFRPDGREYLYYPPYVRGYLYVETVL